MTSFQQIEVNRYTALTSIGRWRRESMVEATRPRPGLRDELSSSRRRKAPRLTELQNLLTMLCAAQRRPRDGRYAQQDDGL